MVATTWDIELIDAARIYVTNTLYPSVHVYTTDPAMQHFMKHNFGARVVPHRGTEDVVISNREGLYKVAIKLYAYGDTEMKPLAATLIKYCNKKKPEARRRVACRLSMQLKTIRQRRELNGKV